MIPRGVALYLVGEERDGHTFHVSVEEGCGIDTTLHGEPVEMPWLRAACSCGWRAADAERTTLEENSHWRWIQHLRIQPT